MAEMNYTVHEQLNLIELRPIGEVSVEDICTYGNSLVDKGIVRDGTIEYVDMTDVTGLIVSYASARDLVDFSVVGSLLVGSDLSTTHQKTFSSESSVC